MFREVILFIMTYLLTAFNVYGSVHRNNILVYNFNWMHKSQIK